MTVKYFIISAMAVCLLMAESINAQTVLGTAGKNISTTRILDVISGPTGGIATTTYVREAEGEPIEENQNWVSLQGKARDIDLGADGSAWLVDPQEKIFRLSPQGWQEVSGSAVRVAAAPDGAAWAVNRRGAIWRNSNNAWQQMPGAGSDVAVGAGGHVWVVGTGNSIFRWQNEAWQQVPGSAQRIAVDPLGNAWIVDPAGNIHRYNGSRFLQIPGQALDIAVDEQSVWIIKPDRSVAAWNGTTGSWQTLDLPQGISAFGITTQPNHLPVILDSLGNLYGFVTNRPELWPGVAFDKLTDASGNRSGAPVTQTNLTLIHGGGYVAYFEVQYVADGKPVSYKSGDRTLGWRHTLQVPSNAEDLRIRAWCRTGLVNEPVKNILSLQTSPAGQCIRIYNTTLKPLWDRQCR